MSIFVGNEKAKLYHGDQHPAELWGPYGIKTTGRNLLDVNKYIEKATTTVAGITFTVNHNGTILVNGTATGNAVFGIGGLRNWIQLKNGKYLLSGTPAGSNAYIQGKYRNDSNVFERGEGAVIAITDGVFRFNIRVNKGETCNNEVFKPMITSSLELSPYEPYTGGKPGVFYDLVKYAGFDIPKVSGQGRVELGTQPYKASLPSVTVHGEGKQDKLEGKNLLPYPYISPDGIYGGVKISTENRGIITLAGVTPVRISIPLCKITLQGQCVLSGGVNRRLWLRAEYNSGVLDDKGSGVTLDTETEYKISLEILDATSVNNFFVAPQIELGSAATPYEPYCGGIPAPNPEYPIEPVFLEGASITDGTNTAPLPILRALPDGSVRDEIDVRTGIIIRRIKKLTLTGKESFSNYESVEKHFDIYVGDNFFKIGTVMCVSNFYESIERFNTREKDYAVMSVDGHRIRFRDVRFTDRSQLTQWLKTKYNSGTPVVIWYVLKTPIIEHYDPAILRQHPGYTQLIQQGGFKPATIDAEYYEEVIGTAEPTPMHIIWNKVNPYFKWNKPTKIHWKE